MTNKEQIDQLSIDKDESVLDAIKKMDKLRRKLLIVTNSGHFHSLVSIGDIQRAILKNVGMESPVSEILRNNIRVAHERDSTDQMKALMLKFRMEMLPVLSDNNEIVELLMWNEVFGKAYKNYQGVLEVPVVIMAGGKGTRLKPITNIIPKALVPIDEKPIVEVIIDKFHAMGSRRFYMSINYRAEMIRSYFDGVEKDYSLEYVTEVKPLGTAGSLHMLRDQLQESFFVTNCDIIIDEDYEQIYRYHHREKNDLTVVAALKHYPIPYGILKTKAQGELTDITEKPEMTFQVNSGMYILEPELLDRIPENEFYHITQLMDEVMKTGGKVGVFPVSEGSWMDIGVWSEYNRTRKLFTENF